jgi:hypothetical protein
MVDTELLDQLAGKIQEARASIACLHHDRDQANEFNLAAHAVIRQSRDLLDLVDLCTTTGALIGRGRPTI